jgi:hypothetical protein
MEQVPPKKRGRPIKPPTPPKPKETVQVVIPELPPPKKRNRKTIAWDQDEEILARLATVANMMVQGAKTHQIKDVFGYDMRTAQRDIARVYTLWRRESMQQVDDARAKSIAQYEEVKTRAWEGYRKVSSAIAEMRIYSPKLGSEQRGWLELAMKAEAQIAKLQGTEKTNIHLSGSVEHTVNARDLSDDELLAIITGGKK